MGNRQIQRPYDIVHGIADDIRQITTMSLDEDVPTTVPSDAIIDSNLFEDTRGYLKNWCIRLTPHTVIRAMMLVRF